HGPKELGFGRVIRHRCVAIAENPFQRIAEACGVLPPCRETLQAPIHDSTQDATLRPKMVKGSRCTDTGPDRQFARGKGSVTGLGSQHLRCVKDTVTELAVADDIALQPGALSPAWRLRDAHHALAAKT